jgi:hypothetical protein
VTDWQPCKIYAPAKITSGKRGATILGNGCSSLLRTYLVDWLKLRTQILG